MKCPKCGNELRESKKTPGYFLCDSCKKKFSQETLDRFQSARPVRRKKPAPVKPEEPDETTQTETNQTEEIQAEEAQTSMTPEETVPEEPVQAEADQTETSPEEPEEETVSEESIQEESVQEESSETETAEPEGQTYSNIPPEEVRNEREKEMKANYEAMLNIKDETSDDSEADDVIPVFGGFRVLIGIVSILCAAFLAYQAYDSGIFTTFIHTPGLTGIAGMVLAVCFLIGGLVVLITHRRNSVPAFIVPCIFYLGGAVGGFFIPGSVMTVQILLFVSALFGAFPLFALGCAKEIHVALRVLVFIVAVAVAAGAYYVAQYVVPQSSASSGKNLRLTTDDFTVSFEKSDIGTDYEGEQALMVYYTITNKGSETLVPSVAVTFKALQDDTTLDPTIVSDEPLSENESAEVSQGDSVRVCTSFILLDQSDVTLQLYETFGSNSNIAETTLNLD